MTCSSITSIVNSVQTEQLFQNMDRQQDFNLLYSLRRKSKLKMAAIL
jgi:hypothetical protein